jgi:hypothetical protein
LVRASAIPAPKAVAKERKITICSGVIPDAITTFEVDAFSPNSTTLERAKITPRKGFLVRNLVRPDRFGHGHQSRLVPQVLVGYLIWQRGFVRAA